MELNNDSSSAVSVNPSSSSSCYPYKRKRFRIDLVPGETTIVSWKKLLGDQGKYEIKEPTPPLQLVQDNLFQLDNSSTKYSEQKVHVEENIIHINEAPKLETHCPKVWRKEKEEASKEKDLNNHKPLQNVISNSHDEKQQHYSFHASVGFSIEKPCDPNIRFECSAVAITVNQCSSTGLSLQDSKGGVCTAYPSANSDNNTKVKRRKEHSTRGQKKDKQNILDQRPPDQKSLLDQLPDLNLPYSASSPTYNPLLAKDASDGRQNATISEKMITKKSQ